MNEPKKQVRTGNKLNKFHLINIVRSQVIAQ